MVSYVLTIGVCFRSSSNDLPDVIVPESQYKLIKKIKYERVKKCWVFYLEFYQFQEQCYGENEQAVHNRNPNNNQEVDHQEISFDSCSLSFVLVLVLALLNTLLTARCLIANRIHEGYKHIKGHASRMRLQKTLFMCWLEN